MKAFDPFLINVRKRTLLLWQILSPFLRLSSQNLIPKIWCFYFSLSFTLISLFISYNAFFPAVPRNEFDIFNLFMIIIYCIYFVVLGIWILLSLTTLSNTGI